MSNIITNDPILSHQDPYLYKSEQSWFILLDISRTRSTIYELHITYKELTSIEMGRELQFTVIWYFLPISIPSCGPSPPLISLFSRFVWTINNQNKRYIQRISGKLHISITENLCIMMHVDTRRYRKQHKNRLMFCWDVFFY